MNRSEINSNSISTIIIFFLTFKNVSTKGMKIPTPLDQEH